MNGVTLESCQSIIEQFEPCPENKSKGLLGIDGEWGMMGSFWAAVCSDRGLCSTCGAGSRKPSPAMGSCLRSCAVLQASPTTQGVLLVTSSTPSTTE